MVEQIHEQEYSCNLHRIIKSMYNINGRRKVESRKILSNGSSLSKVTQKIKLEKRKRFKFVQKLGIDLTHQPSNENYNPINQICSRPLHSSRVKIPSQDHYSSTIMDRIIDFRKAF